MSNPTNQLASLQMPSDAEIWDACEEVLNTTGKPLPLSAVEHVIGIAGGVLAALIRESGVRRKQVLTTFGAQPVMILALS